MKEVGYFYYDNIKYVILKRNDEFLIGKVKGESITFNFTKEDKDVIRIVVDNLVPSGNAVKLLPMKVNGNAYETSYYVDKDLYVFEGAEGNDLSILNSLWNHQETFVAIDLKKTVKDTYQRVVRVGKKVVAVVLIGTMALSLSSSLHEDIEKELDVIPDSIKIVEVLDSENNATLLTDAVEFLEIDSTELIDTEKVEQPEEVKEETDLLQSEPAVSQSNDTAELIEDIEYQTVEVPEVLQEEINVSPNQNDELVETEVETVDVEDKLTVEKIIDIINNNSNLSQEEKDLILSNPQLFEDNLKYFDKDTLPQIFAELYSVYHIESHEIENVAATFTPGDNRMDFYDASTFSETDSYVITHEFCHSLQNHEKNRYAWIKEGINAKVNGEYYEKDPAYDYNQIVITVLNELIGYEALLQCSYVRGEATIIDALYQIIPDYNLSDKFLAYMNCLHMGIIYGTISEEDISFYKTEIECILGQFYEAKFKRSMDDDLKMQYLLDYDNFLKMIKEAYNLQIDDEVLDFVCSTEYKEFIFNSQKPSNNGVITINVPTEAKIRTYDYLTMEEAVEQGVIEMHEDGTYDFVPTPYVVDENGMFCRKELVSSGEYNIYTIDETNRYLDMSMSR